MSRSRWIRLFAGSLAMFPATALLAAEWTISPSVRFASEYADNPRLQVEGGDSTVGAVADLSARVVGRTERSELSLLPRIRNSNYREDDWLDTDELMVDAGVRFSQETVVWTGSAGFVRDTTLTSELDSTGIVDVRRPHQRVSVLGGPLLQATERITLSPQIYWMTNSYSEEEGTGLVDYEYRNVALEAGWAISEQSRGSLSAQIGELLPESNADTRNETLRLTLRHQMNEQWAVEIATGPMWASSDFGTEDGMLYKVGVDRRGERSQWSGIAQRDSTPTGRGVLTRREELRLGFSYSLTEFLSAGMSAAVVSNEDILTAESAASRYDYQRYEGRVTWRITSPLSAVLTVTHHSQSYEGRSGTADSLRTMLSIVWNRQPYLL